MKDTVFTIIDNRRIASATFRMVLEGDTSAIGRPGQFADLKIDGLYLRRPISVCDSGRGAWPPYMPATDPEKDLLTLIYKTVGKGTDAMAAMDAGTELDVLTGLGNGFDVSRAGDRPLLVGGGVGVPPLYQLAKELILAGKTVTAVLGFNTASEVFYADEFRALGCAVTVATADGSFDATDDAGDVSAVKGFVTDALPEGCSYFYACGPLPMLRAVAKTAASDGELSFAERMGCGFGACMGCTMMTASGPKRICKDGPVFRKEDLVWDD